MAGRPAPPPAAALEDGMPGGGTGVAVGAGVPVCLVDLFTAPHRPVPGPSDGTLRDTVEKRRCPFGTAPSLLFLVEMEIAAITAGPQCLSAMETDFFQVTEGVIVTFAEKTAGFRTAARRAGIMPETLVDGQVKFFRLLLKGADPGVTGGGGFPEGPAKYREETGNPFQTGVPVMGGGPLSFSASSPRRFNTV